jgi:stage III sporulation protein AG
MKSLQKFFAVLLTLVVVFGMVGCAGDSGAETTAPAEANGEQASYTVRVKTQGGMALSGLDVYVYADNTLSDLKQYGQTNENGDDSDTVIITDSSRNESGLIRQVNPPVYLGAIVLCQGGDRPSVRLAIVDAVSKVTGLGADRISVLKMK